MVGVIISIILKSKESKLITEGIDIEDFDGYIKLSDIKKYIEESYYEDLVINDQIELLKDGEMIEIEVTIFAKERMIDCDDLEYLLLEGFNYHGGYLLNDTQEAIANKYTNNSCLVWHIFFGIAAVVAILISAYVK